MYKNSTISVVVPAHNEELLIQRVIQTMPDFVDNIVVVDDDSSDKTVDAIIEIQNKNPRVHLIRHPINQGVGGAIATGYKWCRDQASDVTVVMAGDAQMDPADLPALLEPVVNGEVDYSKGNRLVTGEAWKKIPRKRYLGNAALSLLTKIASGYWHVADSQTGYTAINLKALKALDLDNIYRRYGVPNDLLVKLNILGMRVRDVPVKPVYGIGEKSGLKPFRMMPRLAWLVLRLFFHRLIQKYVIRDFHPLVFFYLSGLLLAPAGSIYGLYLVYHRLFIGPIHDNSPLFATFLFISGWQFLLFAMWFDMDSGRQRS